MKKLNKVDLNFIVALAILGWSGNTMAVETNTFILVSTSVVPSCKVSLSHNMAFDYFAQYHAEFINSISIKCTKTTHYEIGVSSGINSSSSNRVMKFESNFLNYVLIVKDPNKQDYDWGDIGSSQSVKNVGTGLDTYIIFNVVMPKAQYVPLGQYTDELLVKFNY